MTFTPRSFFGAGLLAACTVAGAAPAQSITIANRESCVRCTLQINELGRLGSQSSSALSAAPVLIQRAGDGRVFVVDPQTRLISFFSANGKVIRQVGRIGGGPGEYQSVAAMMIDDRGQLMVIDRRLGRLSHFSAEGQFLRSVSMPFGGKAVNTAVVTASGTVVVNAAILTSFSAGFALQEYEVSGRVLRQFDEATVDSRAIWTQERSLAATRDGGVLVGRTHEYRIDRFDSSRKLVNTIRVANSRFPALSIPDRPSDGLYALAPTARLETVWEDAEGLIWAVVHLPSPQWRPQRQDPLPIRLGDELPDWVSRPRLDRYIEVLDPKTRTIVMSEPFPLAMGVPFGAGLTFQLEESDTGIEVTLNRLSLKR